MTQDKQTSIRNKLSFDTAAAVLALALLLFVAAAWANGWLATPTAASATVETPVLPSESSEPVDLPAFGGPIAPMDGVERSVLLHTDRPDFSAFDIRSYTVVEGDTIIGIAAKYDLKPQTIMWGNYDRLYDDPHRLAVGQELRILPTDGLLHLWSEGDGLNGVAKFFKVVPDEIINWPGNHLNPDLIGEYSNPNIEVGTLVFVPGGVRDFISYSAPVISRRDPGRAKVVGPGFCGEISSGATGFGTFVWPTTERRISGYNYDPSTNHPAIDIGGSLGNPIYAADGGVVVYAGWNDWGYGNLIIIDHGTGWQTVYAHLNGFLVGCGQSVTQGEQIGMLGTTGRSSGPHLHFELVSVGGGKVNPLDYLQ